jgi:hypothetical protein
MIISEKQIHSLIVHVHNYIDNLKTLKETNGLSISEHGKENLNNAIDLLNSIYNQQSEELKEIK